MEKAIKIPWNEFVDKAVQRLAVDYPMIETEVVPDFKRSQYGDGDREICELPEYVEIRIR